MPHLSEELIAPCGMNCGTCIAFFGYTMSGSKRKKRCQGCRAENKSCAFLKKKCKKLDKNEINYCYECKSFPCEHLKILDEHYRKRYNISLIDNLISIKEKGMDLFLRSQEDEWKCPECVEIMCCHNYTCFNCGFKRPKN